MKRGLFTMSFSGGPELAAALREVIKEMGGARTKGVIARGMVQAATPFVEAAKANAPRDEGDYADHGIVASTRLTPRQRRGSRVPKDVVRAYAGERAGSSVGLRNEIGTEERFHLDGKSVGRIVARPHMRPAFESTAQQVLDGFVPGIRSELDKAAKRAARKGLKGKGRKRKK